MPAFAGMTAEVLGGYSMRIVVHGQQAFGKAVLEALLKRGENVIAVYVAPEKEGAKADPLKEARERKDMERTRRGAQDRPDDENADGRAKHGARPESIGEPSANRNEYA